MDSSSIRYGTRGVEFKMFMKSLLYVGGVHEDHAETLTSPECMRVYESALTAASVDPVNNYEPYEFVGDTVMNSIVVQYIPTRFPEIFNSKKIGMMNALKVSLIDTKSYAEINETLTISKYVTCTETQWSGVESRMKVLEDTLEALIGALCMQIDDKIRQGLGYGICTVIVRTVLDARKNISLKEEDLYDAVTRLKELIDINQKILGKSAMYSDYESTSSSGEPEFVSSVYVMLNGVRTKVGTGRGALKREAKENASVDALAFLKSRGIYKVKTN